MAEIITEEQPRIKFSTHARGTFTLQAPSDELQSLIVLMEKMEELGAAPVLNDGKVGGNCGISWSLADKVAGSEPDMLVSKSGKEAGAMLQPQDFVRLRCFDRVAWAAEYSAVSADVRPSSDSPLLNACLCSDKARNYGWQHVPRVAIHGHALAEGEGLAYAAAKGIPISEHETLFSTPEDLHELELLFKAHPYPAHKCFVRLGHGFFIIGSDMEDVQQTFQSLVEPFLTRQCS